MSFPTVRPTQAPQQAYNNTQGAQRMNKPNSGTLWVNDRKRKDNDPDYTGKVNVNGVEFYISGWANQTSTGKDNVRISLKPAQEAQQAGTNRAPF